MKLRFDVDQAESFRRGVDCPKSIVTVEVDPAKLSQTDRDLIADRMDGIDVCFLNGRGEKQYEGTGKSLGEGEWEGEELRPCRIIAKVPTFEALMESIRENEKQVGGTSTLRPSPDYKNPNSPIDHENLRLKPEDFVTGLKKLKPEDF